MEELINAMREVVIANRILANEGVVDAYGHVSMRHPHNPERYLMSRSRSPALVTLDDIMEFTLDGEPVDSRDRPAYAERHIHGAIFEKRPEVHSVVHNHSHSVIPFTVTKTPLRPVAHVAGGIGSDLPVWDIRENFGDNTNLLVVNMEQGRDLANRLADNKVVLMRGHGCAVSGTSLKEAVMSSVYLQVNAKLQLQSMQLGGDITYLTPGEAQQCADTMMGELSINRAWEYLRICAGCESM